MKKIYFLIQLPPPIHGASIVNQTIFESTRINFSFETKFLNITLAEDLISIGKFRIRKLFSYLKLIIIVVSQYLSFKPDLTYMTMSPVGYAFLKDAFMLLLIKMMGGKVVVHLHGKGIKKRSDNSKFWSFVYRLIFKKVHIMHLSPRLFWDVQDVRDRNAKLLAIPNGIDFNDTKPVVNKNPVLTFVYLSNLVPGKGADLLIKAALHLPSKLQNKFDVKIFGDSNNKTFKKQLHSLVQNNAHDNIKLLGPVFGQEKYEQLKTGMVFVLPTTYQNECFPISILEAMACGLAVISTKEGAITDIVDNDLSGKVIVEVSEQKLAESMATYIEDQSLAYSHGEYGKHKFENNYMIKHFENNLIHHLNEIIEG
jgi:glycosyltransferase involved in cell wall biosynthesis